MLQGRSWLSQVEVIQGDALLDADLETALQGMEAAYYLIHSMSSLEDFQSRDRLAARKFGVISRQAGLKRIIYLGGLGNPDQDLSPTCAPATRWVTCWQPRVYRWSNSAQQSSSVPAVHPLR